MNESAAVADHTPSSEPRRPSGVLEKLPTRLLYAEDDDDLREMVAIIFTEAGFEVTAVPSAERALACLQAGRFDVVVTDYNLTGETGAWLLRHASAEKLLDRTTVIVLTSERKPADVEGYIVLRKPVDFGILLSTIASAVGKVLPAPVVSLGAPRPAELELVLYVTSSSQESQKALRNLRRALAPYDAARYRLTIVDVAHGGDEDWYRGLEDDRVIVTPTLVKHKPGAKMWILGSLAPIDALEQLLDSVLGSAV